MEKVGFTVTWANSMTAIFVVCDGGKVISKRQQCCR